MKDTKYKYKLGVICGRLNHEHLGHKFIIDLALEQCEKVLILVGSAQEISTLRNPFALETRIKVLRATYPDISASRLIIKGLNDMTNEYDISYDWGKYVRNHIFDYTGQLPDFIITGDDDTRSNWFSEEDLKGVTQKFISRDEIKISATTVRGALLLDNKILWQSFVPKNIYQMYNELRSSLIAVPIYKEIYDKMIAKKSLNMDSYLQIYNEYEKLDKKRKIEEIS